MIKTERDITVRSFQFAVRIVTLCRYLETRGNVSRILADQLLRSGTSIGANLEEAQAGQSKADFVAKVSISRKEARETHYWLKLLAAADLIPAERVTELLDEANQLVAILTTIVKNAKKNDEL